MYECKCLQAQICAKRRSYQRMNNNLLKGTYATAPLTRDTCVSPLWIVHRWIKKSYFCNSVTFVCVWKRRERGLGAYPLSIFALAEVEWQGSLSSFTFDVYTSSRLVSLESPPVSAIGLIVIILNYKMQSCFLAKGAQLSICLCHTDTRRHTCA